MSDDYIFDGRGRAGRGFRGNFRGGRSAPTRKPFIRSPHSINNSGSVRDGGPSDSLTHRPFFRPNFHDNGVNINQESLNDCGSQTSPKSVQKNDNSNESSLRNDNSSNNRGSLQENLQNNFQNSHSPEENNLERSSNFASNDSSRGKVNYRGNFTRSDYRGGRGHFSNGDNFREQTKTLYSYAREHTVSYEKRLIIENRDSSTDNWRNRGDFDPNGSFRGFSRGNYRGNRGHFPNSENRSRGRGRGRGVSSTHRGPFHDPQKPPKAWAVFCFDDYYNISVDEDQLGEFSEMMITQAKEYGMIFEEPKKVSVAVIQDMDDVTLFFEDMFRDIQISNLELIFVGIPSKFDKMSTDSVYQYVKHYCDSEYGIISQCFKADFIKETPEDYFCHFLLKVNAKLGGLNKVYNPMFLQSLPLKMDKTMIVGVVHHAAQFEKVNCSITVAEGSYDNVFSKYSSSVRVQIKEPDDMVMYIESMLRELLHEYRIHNGQYPENLIIYRDGVSRAQFPSFILFEVEPIERLLAKLQSKEDEIKLTVIVVQKRNAPTSNKPGRKIYFPMKTLIDAEVQNNQPDVFDLSEFFKPEDTSLSTKFITVRNAAELSYEDLTKLSYYACQNYSRSMARIDIPTCIRYADLCGGRSKIHAQFQFEEFSQKDQCVNEEAIIRQLNSTVQMDRKMKNLPYYC